MAENTDRFGLLKKDPVAEGTDTFNIKTMLNDNWDKLDGAAKKTELDEHEKDTGKHVTLTKQAEWDAKETPMGAQAKADKALADAKDYADTAVDDAVGDIDLSDMATKSELTAGLSGKVDKVAGKQLTTEDYTTTEKNKLAGIESGANNYVHPATHPASMIEESTSKRFVSDAETTNWNGKETPTGAQAKVDALAGVGNTKTVKQLADEQAAHSAEKVTEQEGVHGIRVNENKGYIEYHNGQRWTAPMLPPDDISGSPGNVNLIAGDMQAGFFGEVPASELWTGSQLADAVGLTQGTLQHNNTPWLKFAYKNKILFTPMKTIRYGVDWNSLDSANVVYGEIKLPLNGLYYKVRLFKGTEHNPSDSSKEDKDTAHSEWNSLMLPIHEKASTGGWTYPQYVKSVPNWELTYTDRDLMTDIDLGNGGTSLCQEQVGTTTGLRVYRAMRGASGYGTATLADTSNNRGWRPVLELVE